MSDQDKGTPSSQAEGTSEFAQLKGEMNRKLSKTEELMNSVIKQNEALMAKLAGLEQKPRKQVDEDSSEKEIEDAFYSNPKKYAELVEKRAETKIMSKLQQQNEVNGIIGSLASDYPELSDKSSDLYKRAVDKYSQMSQAYQASPLSYKLAVKEAAEELDIKPRAKRQSSQDDFVGTGSSRTTRRRTEELDPATAEVAELLGVDVSNPEVKKRLIASQSKNHSQWNKVKK